MEGLGVEGPQGEGFTGPLGEDNKAVDDGEHFVEQEFAVDRFRAGLDFGELEEVRLGSHRAYLVSVSIRSMGLGLGQRRS